MAQLMMNTSTNGATDQVADNGEQNAQWRTFGAAWEQVVWWSFAMERGTSVEDEIDVSGEQWE